MTPTVTVYDVLDRALSVKQPDESETTTEYTLDSGSNALVTKVTDALGNSQSTVTNGSGKTLKSIQHSGPDGEITTTFEYDGIQRLVRVTDTEGNVTTSVYDMGDRRTEVSHPASGITSFTYDPLGNVLTKQTANMAEEGKMITYTYDYHRLTGISYPDHPENNVKYYYGGRNASHNRIGRLMMREDGTGAIEYFYGKMGEVTKTRRTLIVPNQAIATYVTQWTYDSHNRLLEMIYPDEEKVTYSYNLGGQLEKVRGEKSYGYDYITKLGYDKFEQRSYLKYCNGAETFYTYDNRRRLSNLAVNSGNTAIMDNDYTFDAVSNVLSVANNASLPASGNAGGKTVCLKTLGLCVAMTLSGLPVPAAAGSHLPWFGRVDAFIGDEQSLEDNVSTFTAQIRHLAKAWKHLDSTGLVLLDEFGAGTDPAQGAALAQGVLDGLLDKRTFVLAATHFPALKTYALSREGARAALRPAEQEAPFQAGLRPGGRQPGPGRGPRARPAGKHPAPCGALSPAGRAGHQRPAGPPQCPGRRTRTGDRPPAPGAGKGPPRHPGHAREDREGAPAPA